MKNEKLEIISRCGDIIKVGTTFYEVNEKSISSYREDRKRYCITKTGDLRTRIDKYKVIRVNHDIRSRNFIMRSDKGCEITLSVKDQCLPDNLFTKLSNAKKYKKELDKEDYRNVLKKIDYQKSKLKNIEKDIKMWGAVAKKIKNSAKI